MRSYTFKISNAFSQPFAWLLLFLVPLALSSCEDIGERDLTDRKVTLLAPQDNSMTSVLANTFLWEELEGALEYQLQIATPSFDSIEILVLDSTVASRQFTFQLSPRKYEWRVRARNGSSETAYVTRSLTVLESNDLTNQQLILISPAANLVTNQSDLTFNWFHIPSATQYSYLIKSPDFNGSLVLPENLSPDSSLALTGLAEGIYAWGVRAENTLSNTLYSTRTLSIDFTSPGTPVLSQPANNATVGTDQLTFNWTRPADTGANPTTITDSLYVHTDTAGAPFRQYGTTNTTVQDSFPADQYWWRVGSQDAAGNTSAFSNWRSFTAQ